MILFLSACFLLTEPTDTGDTDTEASVHETTFEPEGGTYTFAGAPFYGDCNFYEGYYPEMDGQLVLVVEVDGDAVALDGIDCTGTPDAFRCTAAITDGQLAPDTVVTTDYTVDGTFFDATEVGLNYTLVYSCAGANCADAYASFGDDMPCSLVAGIEGTRTGD
jgi:hypothetical protein